jgi:hypothetical protein
VRAVACQAAAAMEVVRGRRGRTSRASSETAKFRLRKSLWPNTEGHTERVEPPSSTSKKSAAGIPSAASSERVPAGTVVARNRELATSGDVVARLLVMLIGSEEKSVSRAVDYAHVVATAGFVNAGAGIIDTEFLMHLRTLTRSFNRVGPDVRPVLVRELRGREQIEEPRRTVDGGCDISTTKIRVNVFENHLKDWRGLVSVRFAFG